MHMFNIPFYISDALSQSIQNSENKNYPKLALCKKCHFDKNNFVSIILPQYVCHESEKSQVLWKIILVTLH